MFCRSNVQFQIIFQACVLFLSLFLAIRIISIPVPKAPRLESLNTFNFMTLRNIIKRCPKNTYLIAALFFFLNLQIIQ